MDIPSATDDHQLYLDIHETDSQHFVLAPWYAYVKRNFASRAA